LTKPQREAMVPRRDAGSLADQVALGEPVGEQRGCAYLIAIDRGRVLMPPEGSRVECVQEVCN
jgi:hypothetical protein